MTLLKTAAVTLLAWGALGSFVEAAPLSWYGSSNVSAWYANQTFANGGFYAPSSAPVAAYSYAGWFNNPAYLATLGPTAQPAAPAPAPAPAPVPIAAPVPKLAADAFINMSSSGFGEANNLTTGNAQPWYNSPSVIAAFGGIPNSGQQASFVQNVLADVQRTFQNSGLNISLTSDPGVSARHMLSVVSGASYPSNPGAIGITTVGGNGFSFIDKLAYAANPDQLAWAVAHNVAHELMHGLGVGSHPDATGEYLDAATANWTMLIDPNAKFSPEAVALIQSAQSGTGINSGGIDGKQLLEAPVPEPATVVVWSLSALGAFAIMRRKARRSAA